MNLLARRRKISKEEGALLAKELQVRFIETSAKSGDKVTECFESVAKEVCGKIKTKE